MFKMGDENTPSPFCFLSDILKLRSIIIRSVIHLKIVVNQDGSAFIRILGGGFNMITVDYRTCIALLSEILRNNQYFKVNDNNLTFEKNYQINTQFILFQFHIIC